MSASTANAAVIYFSMGKELHINDGKAVLQVMGTSGVISEVDVVIGVDGATARRRRMQMVQDHIANGRDYSDLAARCSYTSGVCYHTFEEIQALHLPSEQEVSMSGSVGRSLAATDTSSVGYAEINADTAILLKNSYSSLSQAGDFLKKIFGNAMTDGKNGTTKVIFTMKERCANYVDLVDECRNNPAPVNSFDGLQYGNNSKVYPPFMGLFGDNSIWVFVDEIEYSKDPYTIQLKVYFHLITILIISLS
jgi:hypothetical protein